jgi:uncharacterized protein YcgL (UPF0745 family)
MTSIKKKSGYLFINARNEKSKPKLVTSEHFGIPSLKLMQW